MSERFVHEPKSDKSIRVPEHRAPCLPFWTYMAGPGLPAVIPAMK